ncbi:MAG: PAS domain S-box protein [Bacteroidota bacterium]|nr:PAS domain S-box protein [Bacteroidota bacterium]
MTDYKEKYHELLENNRKLKDEISSLKSKVDNKTVRTGGNTSHWKGSQKSPVKEIFETISTYLALFSVSDDNIISLVALNEKAAEVEAAVREEVIGKPVKETLFGSKPKLIELVLMINDTGSAQKILASPRNDDSEGCYIGFKLTSGKILVTWEPGKQQKRKEDIERRSLIFEEFADMLPEMVYEVDITGRVLYANTQALKFFGYTKEDVARGMNIVNVFPEAAGKMISNLKGLVSPEQVSSNEYILKKKDGSQVPILTHSFAIFHHGRISGYRGVVTDISKHREYEEQINREKAFLEHLIDSIPEAIAIISKEGKVTIINKEFTNLFGFTFEEAVGKNIDQLIVPDDMKEEAINVNVLATENNKVVRQTIRQDKNGNRIQVSLVASNILIDNEVVSLLGIYRDITLERKNQIIQEILYNISTAALNSLDVKDIYPTIVRELSKIWDTNNFFIALYNKKYDTLSMPFFADEKDKFENLPASKTITRWVIMLKKSVLLKVNDLRDLENSGDIDLVGTPCKIWMGVPLKAEKEIIGVMALQDYHDENKFSHDDVNVLEFIANQIAIAIQRRTMLDDVIQASRKAEEAAQSKQQFMSTMSHEIRTPLNEVIGITNLLLQGNPREDQMDYIKTLRFSGNHLLTLVNDVLDYNKMESGKIFFEQAQFNLSEFLNDIMRTYSFRSKSKNLDFDIIKGNDLPVEVIGDSLRLNQILSNLLSNALKFTEKGGIHVVLKQLENTGKIVKIEFLVRDSGLGIPSDKQEIIFDSFTQASPDTTRHYGGTGLGLAICKKLVELQGGEIGVESEPGKGSTFRFILSFGIPEKVGKIQVGERPESYIGLEGKKILVAEDNKINFFVANKFLQGWGANVTHAENGKIALDLLEKEEFDLIIMDLHMPVLDGIEATRIIRKSQDPKISSIPVVALTAAIMSESHDKIDDLNINDYVLKPFKPRDLFDKILRNVR